MSTLTVQPSAPIVAPLLADWLLDLLPPGRPRRISTMLLCGRTGSGICPTPPSTLSPALGVERYHMPWHFGRAATSGAPTDWLPSAHHRCGLLAFAECVTWRSSARHRIWRIPEPRHVRR